MFRGQDVRKSGSGNIGATNVARTGSKGLAIATLLLDAVKGYAAVALAFHLCGVPHALLSPAPSVAVTDISSVPLTLHLAYLAAAFSAFCAMIGHMFPVWLGFRGGKGVATALGGFVRLAPLAVLVAVGVFILTVLVFRRISLGSVVTAALFPTMVWLLNLSRDPLVLLLIGIAALLIIVRHYQNILRLLSGEEPKFSLRRK